MSSHSDPDPSSAAAEADDGEADELPPLPAGAGNYMTPAGFRRLDEELRRLSRVERPKVVEVVAWAAGNGDRPRAPAGAGRRQRAAAHARRPGDDRGGRDILRR